ncbi:MAG TPA: glycoside hydrolase family 3 N-terminal domain-containing protein [Chitinivibrionales bacterium]|nr:glycoside hydrolase family 3 N-terminal domain-containing protein [Chitinivibrionales bacterium]
MKSIKFISLTAVALLAYTTVFAQSLDFSVSGKVVLANGSPVANATVTYQSIAKRLSWDFSKSDGTFGGYSVSTSQPLQQNSTLTLLGEGPVSIDIFDISGKKVESVYNARIEKGIYALEPITSKLSKSVYLMKIRAGNQVIYRKLLKTGLRTGSASVYELSSSNTPMVMAKKLAVIDSIRVGKTGYAPTYVPIQTYSDNVGNVTIAPIDIESKVDALFNQMTDLQRYGQLCMPPNSIGNLASSCASNNCGSIFGGGGALVGSSASACADQVDGCQTAMMGTALKIPIMAAYDFVHGASAVPGATMLPHNLALGAVQDSLLVQKAWRVAALEVRGSGCNWGFGPCIAVIRDDRWGRSYEGFCETPERTQIMARHAVLGAQLTDLSCPLSYAACIKHFAGDGNTANGVNQGETVGPDATARAINLPGYAAGVAAGVATVMPSFSSWCDGTPMHQNKTLITGWLKDSTNTGTPPSPGFKGLVVGDWEASWPLPTCEGAGVDVPMAPGCNIGIIATNDPNNNNNFVKMAAMGATQQARIYDACKRVLRVKAWMGMFNSGYNPLADRRLTPLVGCAAHRDVARQCVRASQVLLKNANNVLPMPKTANLAIWGQAGDDIGIQCGGWTVSWQGQQGAIPGGGGTSIRTACQAVGATVSFVSSPNAVGNSDYILAVFSENPYAETSFPNINLTGNDATGTNQAVINEVAAAHTAGKKVIGMLIAGRVLDISTVINNCDAFIWSCLPGTEGEGIADVLFGDYKFSGKLPVTWPTSSAQEPINSGDGQTGMYAYGFGLTD